MTAEHPDLVVIARADLEAAIAGWCVAVEMLAVHRHPRAGLVRVRYRETLTRLEAAMAANNDRTSAAGRPWADADGPQTDDGPAARRVRNGVIPANSGNRPIGVAPVGARSGPLTRRETEVACAVADGLTNKQVARRLGISEWTVVNHMRGIMRKLNQPSRVQVAQWVWTELDRTA